MPDLISKPPLICLMGPTASGKTDLAISAAQRLNGELVCSDLTQMYNGLSILTNKQKGDTEYGDAKAGLPPTSGPEKDGNPLGKKDSVKRHRYSRYKLG